ncbi:MAG TPA: hypothetical protein VMT37_09690 [Solirubrobacterales bacterium]|nr:hypothetical protein [Solirubrobacterales bacterium]
MRIWTGLALASAALVLSAPTLSSAATARQDRLALPAASKIANQIGASIVRRSHRLRTYEVSDCTRIEARRVNCVVNSHGEARRHRIEIDCRFRIAVGLTGAGPSGRVVSHRCKSDEPPYLARPRAVKALWEALLGTHPQQPQAQMTGIKRVSSRGFSGRGVWVTSPGPNTIEGCGAEMSIRLSDSGELAVEMDEPECKVTWYVSG